MSRPYSSAKPPAWRYAACYALYLAILTLCVASFLVWQEAIGRLVGVVVSEPEAMPAVFGFATFLLGLGIFVLAIVAESYLRAGVRRQQLRRRFARLALPLLAIAVLGLIVQEAIVRLA